MICMSRDLSVARDTDQCFVHCVVDCILFYGHGLEAVLDIDQCSVHCVADWIV